MLASYAKGISAMLKLPQDDPRNWFRHAFTHFMDCPHGNWWFYNWHRGYIGLFEQTIRNLSGDANFALPFWDWSASPEIPASMFEGLLTPTDAAYRPYTKDIATFTAYIQPSLKRYWATLTPEQMADQKTRGINSFDDLWAGVTSTPSDPGDAAFAPTDRARYLSQAHPKLDQPTTYDTLPEIILSGLEPRFFYASDAPPKYQQALSFNSIKTKSHLIQPGAGVFFSILEGMPHNNVHNNIGGTGHWNPGPFGYMTNFLSPVDPIFFLHHANMDRLWDVWTRKQKALGLSFKPQTADEAGFMAEPFRFFADGNGHWLLNAKAGDYFDTDAFGYDYGPGTGDAIIPDPRVAVANAPRQGVQAVVQATMRNNVGTLSALNEHQAHLVAAVTLQVQPDSGRSFHVLVNAPAGAVPTGPDSPHFVGQIAFFGPPGHHMHHGPVTFLVPLTVPQSGSAPTPKAPLMRAMRANEPISISVASADTTRPAPTVTSIAVQAF